MTIDVDLRRRRLGDCPLTPEQAYTITNKMDSICNEVRETKRLVQDHHDILVRHEDIWERIEKMEQKIDTIFNAYNQSKGMMVVLIGLSGGTGAILAVIVNWLFFK